MADNVIARKNDEWDMVSSLPDVCKTPMGGSTPGVPYNVVSHLEQSKGTTGSVKANDDKTMVFDQTKVPKTEGDEAGTAKGVKSGTVGEDSWPQEKSSTVKAEDKEVVRNDDKAEMNGKFKDKEEEEKAKRQKCREEQLAAGRQSANPAVREAASRFDRNISAMENAKLSDHVYRPGDPPPAGWRDISGDRAALARYGLTPEDMRINGTNFRAGMYEPNPDVFGNRFQPTAAFQGTDPAKWSDWSNNVRQGLNMESPYYRQAVGMANRIGASGAEVSFTGHSLGGGLASAASQATGGRGWTFNSAGLHSRTVTGYGGVVRGNGSQINAYRVDGDPLTAMSEQSWSSTLTAFSMFGWKGALGKVGISAAMPDAIGNKFQLPGHGVNPVGRHSMGQVKEGIEGQKEQDQKAIAKDTGKEC